MQADELLKRPPEEAVVTMALLSVSRHYFRDGESDHVFERLLSLLQPFGQRVCRGLPGAPASCHGSHDVGTTEQHMTDSSKTEKERLAKERLDRVRAGLEEAKRKQREERGTTGGGASKRARLDLSRLKVCAAESIIKIGWLTPF